ncbi:MAG: WG repeat-containing protein, partial [Bacteroidota bacterium]
KNPTRLRPFSEGLSVFRDQSNNWGYLNQQGEVVIAPQFQMARPFSEGRALVRASDGEFIFINPKGEKVFGTGLYKSKQWKMIGDFKNGRCWFKKADRGFKWGCYDRDGNVAIEPQFYYRAYQRPSEENIQCLPMDFAKGVAAIQQYTNKKALRSGIIDTMGHYILEPKDLAVIHSFDQAGYASFQAKKNGLYGLINWEGTIIIPPRYKMIEQFVEGYARVKKDNDRWGIINQRGQEIIPAKYLAVDTLSEGLVAVRSNARGWYYVNTQNRRKIKGPFKEAQEFKNGISLVKKGDQKIIINNKGERLSLKEGQPIFFSSGILGVETIVQGKRQYYYADASGHNIFGRYFEKINPFHLVSAKVQTQSRLYTSKRYKGAVNKRGVMVVPPKFNTLHFQPDGTIIVNPQVYRGIVNKQGKMVLPPVYDQVIPVNTRFYPQENDTENKVNTIFRIEDGEKIGYVRLLDNQIEWIWEVQY